MFYRVCGGRKPSLAEGQLVVMYVHTHSRTYLRAGARARRTYALTKKVLKIVNFNMDLSKIDTYYNQITSNAMR